jgi:hypothetical protein
MSDINRAMVHVMSAIRDEIRDLAFVLDPERTLTTAPTVEDVVWCNEWKKIYGRTSAGIYRCESFVGLAVPGVCPGPHRTLLLGPEVTP